MYMLGSMICAADVDRPARIGSTEPMIKSEPNPALTPQKAAVKPAIGWRSNAWKIMAPSGMRIT